MIVLKDLTDTAKRAIGRDLSQKYIENKDNLLMDNEQPPDETILKYMLGKAFRSGFDACMMLRNEIIKKTIASIEKKCSFWTQSKNERRQQLSNIFLQRNLTDSERVELYKLQKEYDLYNNIIDPIDEYKQIMEYRFERILNYNDRDKKNEKDEVINLLKKTMPVWTRDKDNRRNQLLSKVISEEEKEELAQLDIEFKEYSRFTRKVMEIISIE